MKGNNDIFCFIQFKIIEDIYCEYFVVGVDIIEINIFNFISILQVDYVIEVYVYELNKVVVVIVWCVIDFFLQQNFEWLCFVVGVIGLFNKILLLLLDVNDFGYCVVIFDEVVVFYSEQINGFFDGGVDLLFVEIIFDIFNVKVVFFVIEIIFVECGQCWFIIIFGIIIDVSGCIFLG